jgi:drug/metabolite transporter (DMT)-like permease
MSIPAAYLGTILIWSTTPLAVQWSAQGAGFSFAVFARMVIGTVLALLLLTVWRIGLPLHRRARAVYLAGGLATFVAMTLIYWGARLVHSGLVSVMFGLSPLITGILAAMLLGEQPLRARHLAGMGLALFGLATIFLRGDGIGGEHALAGLVALLAAVTVHSFSLVWIKRIGDDSPPLAITAGTLLVSLPLFALTWWLVDGHVPATVPPRAEAAIVYLGIFGSVLGFALYYYLLKHHEAGRVALITLVTPVLALSLGSVVNGEEVALRVWFGAAFIVGGLLLHQWESVREVTPAFANRFGR